MKGMTMLDTVLRLILWRQFEGSVFLGEILPGEKSCVLEHSNGVKGVVSVGSVFALEMPA